VNDDISDILLLPNMFKFNKSYAIFFGLFFLIDFLKFTFYLCFISHSPLNCKLFQVLIGAFPPFASTSENPERKKWAELELSATNGRGWAVLSALVQLRTEHFKSFFKIN